MNAETETHRRLADQPAGMGCTRAACSCGWTSAPTNRPQHLGRTYRSHATDAARRNTRSSR